MELGVAAGEEYGVGGRVRGFVGEGGEEGEGCAGRAPGFEPVGVEECEGDVAGSGDLGNINIGFKSSTGLVLEGEYLFSPKFGAKARVASHEFESKLDGAKIDGNYFGLMLNYYF